MKLRPYPTYKDSGVEWLGEIPEEWKIKRLKYVCSKYAEYGLNIAAENYQIDGIRFIRTTDIDDYGNLKGEGVYLNESLAKGYILNSGDLLISRSGTIGRSFLYDSSKNEKATYAGYLVRYSLDEKETFPKYIFYFIQGHSFFEWLKTQLIETTISNVNGQKYANLSVTLPSLDKQIQITNYLDQKTSKIDDLIKKNERLIEFLKEKRQVIISQAVTKGLPAAAAAQAGLDPNAKMKDSGVEWLGKIPEGWEVQKLKHICNVKFSNVDKKSFGSERPVRLCNYVDVYNNDFITDEIEFMKATASRDEIAKFTLKKGDVIITKDSESWDDIAVPAYVFSSLEGVLCGYHLAHIRPDGRNIEGRYLLRAFVAQGINDQFRVSANGITRYGLSKHSIKSSLIPVPPNQEQIQIANYLDQKTTKIDGLIKKIKSQIEKLKEYRQTLISNVVTGKVRASDTA